MRNVRSTSINSAREFYVEQAKLYCRKRVHLAASNMNDRKRCILKGFLCGLKTIFDDEADEISVNLDTGGLSAMQLMGVESPVRRDMVKRRKVLLGASLVSQKPDDDSGELGLHEMVSLRRDREDDDDGMTDQQVPYDEPAAEQSPEEFERLTFDQNEWDFKATYHLHRSTVKWLIGKMATGLIRHSKTGRPQAPVEVTILLSLWALANPEPFRCISQRYGVGMGHAHRAFITFCKLLHRLQDEYIIWPDGATSRRLLQIAAELDDGRGFPDVIGCVDATRISIRTPKEADVYRVDRKHHASIVLQAVCDTNLRFTNVFVGCPGSSTDSWAWRQSPLGRQLNDDPSSLIPGDMHLLGDAAFPLRSYLMTPYRDRFPSDAQRVFNEKLNAKRAAIEQAFGQLRGRFQRLKYVNVLQTELVSVVVTAACVLHNICIEQDDECPEVMMEVDEDYGSDTEDDFGTACVGRAQEKRDRLCTLMADI